MRFEEFAAARLPALMRCATLLCTDREEAQDLVQESLTRALVKWDRIVKVEEPYAYVRKILTNQFLSWRRRRKFQTVPLGPGHEPAPSPDPDPEHGDRLWHLLGDLPRQQRAVLVLRYYEGLTDDEIAETLSCRPGTVRGYASRALATLRIEITEHRAAEGVRS